MPTPEEIPRIEIDELKHLMDLGAEMAIVDTHPRAYYEEHHIEGAISIPWTMEGIPWEEVQELSKEKLTITYCDCGPGESDSAEIASRLMEMGFMNVKVLADPSLRGWIERGYPIAGGS